MMQICYHRMGSVQLLRKETTVCSTVVSVYMYVVATVAIMMTEPSQYFLTREAEKSRENTFFGKMRDAAVSASLLTRQSSRERNQV